MDNKVWSDLYGYEDLYLIDRNGNIWSKTKKKQMHPFLTKNGYYRVSLWTKDGYKKGTVRVRAMTEEVEGEWCEPVEIHCNGSHFG